MRIIQRWLIIITLFASSHANASEQIEVDANLVTGLDISDSVGRYEEWLEREGLAKAVVHRRLLKVMRTGQHQRVGFSVFTWSSHGRTEVIIPWTVIGSREDAERVSERLMSIRLVSESKLSERDIPIEQYDGSKQGANYTDIGLAIRFGSDYLRAASHKSGRSVINIVGNGPSNSGVTPDLERDVALDAGHVINGVVIGYGAEGTSRDVEYYRSHVIGGPGSFVMQVSSPREMVEAFATKFALDIAGSNLPPSELLFAEGAGEQWNIAGGP